MRKINMNFNNKCNLKYYINHLKSQKGFKTLLMIVFLILGMLILPLLLILDK